MGQCYNLVLPVKYFGKKKLKVFGISIKGKENIL